MTYEIAFKKGLRKQGATCTNGGCEYDTRPHTPAAPAKDKDWATLYPEVKEMCGACLKREIAKARKAEREQVLDEFKWMKPQCFGNHDACCDTKCAWVVRKRCVQSLRGSAEQGGERR